MAFKKHIRTERWVLLAFSSGSEEIQPVLSLGPWPACRELCRGVPLGLGCQKWAPEMMFPKGHRSFSPVGEGDTVRGPFTFSMQTPRTFPKTSKSPGTLRQPHLEIPSNLSVHIGFAPILGGEERLLCLLPILLTPNSCALVCPL